MLNNSLSTCERVGFSFKISELEGPIQSVHAWMMTKIQDVALHGRLDALAKQLEGQISRLPGTGA